jgi:hypothetical protein
MSRYRKIDPRFWKDEKIMDLPPTEKLIALYSFTGQSNRIGLFNFSPGEAAEDLNLNQETFREGFGKVCQRLNFGWDETFRVLYLPTCRKYNCPENPNVLKSCLADLHEIPQTPLVAQFSTNLSYLPETFHQTFREGLPKPSPQRMPDQEQEQEKRVSDKRSPSLFSQNGGKPNGATLASNEAVSLAEFLSRRIEENIPNRTKPTKAQLTKWAKEADLMHHRDGHSWEEIRELLEWSQSDPFWKANILSMGKFREKWNQLSAHKQNLAPEDPASIGGSSYEYLRRLRD